MRRLLRRRLSADPDASEADPAGNTTAYTYDGNSNLLSATDPTGAKTTFTHDAADR
ncbi:RHS repeat domain-containing protein [Kitasatospora purpeofusca]|uniref:YD repeat-containing protein n=1 Tax=Kitasatospora purpeofusca TaxID=67352 RepID=A0ABZ1TX53_9ACTN|nr:RHS repeat domain-containing protein [Kitasatospora purpeofusca]